MLSVGGRDVGQISIQQMGVNVYCN